MISSPFFNYARENHCSLLISGKLQSAADAISRCKPLHMLYISIGQTGPADSDEEFMEFLELKLEDVYVAVNLINSDEEVNMMSWDVIHRAT